MNKVKITSQNHSLPRETKQTHLRSLSYPSAIYLYRYNSIVWDIINDNTQTSEGTVPKNTNKKGLNGTEHLSLQYVDDYQHNKTTLSHSTRARLNLKVLVCALKNEL